MGENNTSNKTFNLFKDSLTYAFSKALPGITGLLSVILFFRLVGPAEYGRFSLLFTFANMCAAFSFGWLNQSILRYYSTFQEKQTFSSIVKKGLFISTLCSGVLIITLQAISFPQDTSVIMLIMLTVMIGGFAISCIYFQADQQPFTVLKLTSFQAILAMGLPMIFILIFHAGFTSIIWGVVLAYALPFFWVINNFRSTKTSKKNNTDLKHLSYFFKYGWPLSFWFVANISLRFLDRFFIEKYFDSSLMGSYASFTELMTRIFSLILFPITMALHPRIMNLWNNDKRAEAANALIKGIKFQLFIFVTFLLAFYVFKEPIFNVILLLIPDIDLSLKFLLLPVFIGGFLWQLALLIHKPLELNEKPRIMLLCIVISVLINMGGNIIFLPKYGIIATAYTTIISGLSYIICTLLFAGSHIKKFIKS